MKCISISWNHHPKYTSWVRAFRLFESFLSDRETVSAQVRTAWFKSFDALLRLCNEESWIEGAKLQVLTGLCSAGLPSSSLTSTTQQNPLYQMPSLYMVQIGIQIRGKSFPLFEQIAIDSPPSQVRAPDGKYFHWLTANRLWSSHWINSWIRKLAKAHNLIFALLWITAAWWDCFALSLSFQLLSLLAPCSPIYQT